MIKVSYNREVNEVQIEDNGIGNKTQTVCVAMFLLKPLIKALERIENAGTDGLDFVEVSLIKKGER
jgi:hypothetical protein